MKRKTSQCSLRRLLRTMACDGYDITLSFDDASETDSAIYSDDSDEMDCPDRPSMNCRCNMDEGVKLEMWRHSSMKQVVNIIIALKRMKHIKTESSEFGEEEVLNIIMERVIEERQMERVELAEVTPSYIKDVMVQCNVCDQFKKTLVKTPASPRLLAITLKNGNSQFKVDFSMSLYASTKASSNASQPVCLGIAETNLYLACTKQGDAPPHLILKEIRETLNTIKAGDQYDNLLFFRQETGVANNTFESVKYPGWFISTAYEDSQQVEMSQVSENRCTIFNLQNQKRIRS